MRSRRDTNTETTIAALLTAGRAGFGARGFEATGLEDIAVAARVTTGAIYHHFAGKKGLFLAVAEQIEAELLAHAMAVDDPDPWKRTHKAFAALLDACAKPDVQRIVFLDAPRVLGPEAWREVELKYAYGGMSLALTQLIQAGIVRPYPVELIAPLLLSVLHEATHSVAISPALRGDAMEVMSRVLDCLRRDPAP